MGHIDSDFRREILTAELKNNLKKIAGITLETECGFVPSPYNSATRNKLSMPFGIADGKTVLGFYKHDTHIVQPVVCKMSGTLSEKTAQIVADFANANRLSVYDQATGRGLLRHLVVREISGRASATLVINADCFDGERALADSLPENVDFFVCPNTKRNNVILGDSVRLVKGKSHIEVNVLGVTAELSPLSFFQVNDAVRDELYKRATELIRSDALVDLYSGIGITSNLAARKCKTVTAVECVPQAVADADRTAALNGNERKIKNICGDVAEVLSAGEIAAKDCDVLVDPPRKGCGIAVMRAVARLKPARLIYISCNHATMCRDIKEFIDCAGEYSLDTPTVFDMFPSTHHTETLVCLTRR